MLHAGLATLASAQQAAIGQRIAALAPRQSRPVICPLLGQHTGACTVYAQRPIACRTYGFYVRRDQGLFGQEIEALAGSGALDDVLWGNQDGIDQQCKPLGPTRSLLEWFASATA